jgi:hypothetical protein
VRQQKEEIVITVEGTEDRDEDREGGGRNGREKGVIEVVRVESDGGRDRRREG